MSTTIRPVATSSVISSGSIAMSPGKVPGSHPATFSAVISGFDRPASYPPEVAERLVALADGLLEAGLGGALLEGEALRRVAGDAVEEDAERPASPARPCA